MPCLNQKGDQHVNKQYSKGICLEEGLDFGALISKRLGTPFWLLASAPQSHLLVPLTTYTTYMEGNNQSTRTTQNLSELLVEIECQEIFYHISNHTKEGWINSKQVKPEGNNLLVGNRQQKGILEMLNGCSEVASRKMK